MYVSHRASYCVVSGPVCIDPLMKFISLFFFPLWNLSSKVSRIPPLPPPPLPPWPTLLNICRYSVSAETAWLTHSIVLGLDKSTVSILTRQYGTVPKQICPCHVLCMFLGPRLSTKQTNDSFLLFQLVLNGATGHTAVKHARASSLD